MQMEFNVFFFIECATTEIYTLSLHDALPISGLAERHIQGAFEHALLDFFVFGAQERDRYAHEVFKDEKVKRSEEHTSELQSHSDLVCRLLLEKKNKKISFSFQRMRVVS